ncbi:hypothetical protein ACFWP5_39795 [Streptomyces sp. NPDC058469]|uniref:hypothetical protein n=1 Tax=Streptomyces sp. NPDC058469 TaxID=3346514 RepID=UPI003648AF47
MRKRTLLLAAPLTTGLLSALPVTTASAAPSGLTGGDLESPGAAVISYGTTSGIGTKASLADSGRPSLGDNNGDGHLNLALGYPEESASPPSTARSSSTAAAPPASPLP